MSHGLHQQVDRNEFVVPANWKLWIENALEAYHARWVHPESFNPLVPREDHYNYAGSHSSMAGDMMVSPAHQKLTERLFGDRPYRCKGYEHYFVFPNMLLSTAQGASFNLMIVDPLGPKQSRVVSRVYLTQSSAPPTRTTTLLFKELGSASAEFSRQVLSEDLKIVSAVQAGIQESNYEGILSTLEERIHRFQQEWISCIGKSTSKDPVSPRRKQDRQVP